MNNTQNNKIFVFGNENNLDWLTPKTTREILEEAYIKVNIINEIKLEYIIDILDKVSNAWKNQDYYYRKEATKTLLLNTSFSNEIINQGLDYISNICSKAAIIQKINFELGSIDYLNNGLSISSNTQDCFPNNDNIKGKRINNYILKAKSKGVLLHINSNNIFFEIIDYFISGIITKNINLIKIDSVNYDFLHLFIQSIKEFDISDYIFSNQAILLWNNSNQDIEEIIINGVDKIIFNGDYNLLENIRSKIINDIQIIRNLYSFSFAVIEGKLIKANNSFQIFNNLAIDICRWNQKIASSPHVIYIIDKDLKSSHVLIESLFDEMIQVCDDLPIGNLSFDEKIEIRKVRELSKFNQIKGEGRLVCPDDFSFTLILEYNSKFKESCLNRTVYIKRVLNLDSLFEQLLPLSGKLNTAGVYISDDLKKALERDFVNLGVKRITHIGNMCCNNLDAPQNGYFLLRELVDWVTVI